MTTEYRGGIGRETAGRRSKPGSQKPSLGPLEAACDSVIAAAADALAAVDGRLADARSAEATALKRAEREAAMARTAAGNQLHAKLSRALEALDEATTALDFGCRGAAWNDSIWSSASAEVLDTAEAVRVGDLVLRPRHGSPTNQPVEVPLLVPLLDHGNVLVRTREPAKANALFQSVTLRALTATGPGQLKVHLHDPMASALSALFTGLRTTHLGGFPASGVTDQDLRSLLEDLTADVRRISNLYRGRPFDLGAFLADSGQPVEPYQLVIIADYPRGVSRESNDLLATLLRSAPKFGISFVIHVDPDATPERDVDPTLITQGQFIVDLTTDPGRCSAFPDYEVVLDPPPPPELTEQVVARIVADSEHVAVPAAPFPTLPDHEVWNESSRDHIETAFGVAANEPVVLRLGDDRDQRHHVLVSGTDRRDKTNLLMTIVHGFAQRYSPAELEMYLLDLEDGTTLRPLSDPDDGTGWLPHARVLGLEPDRHFGAAVLAHLVQECEQRARAMKPTGDSFARHRDEQPDAAVPRILTVIDEFHVLFDADDDLGQQALADLKRLAEQGPTYGIHLMLASQALPDTATTLAERDDILAEFSVRLTVENSTAESRVAHDQENAETSRRRDRSQVLVSVDIGATGADDPAVVYSTTPESLAKLRQRLWQHGHDRPPTSFVGAKPASLTDEITVLQQMRDAARSNPRSRLALLGTPVAVDATPTGVSLSADTGGHLALVGSGTPQAANADDPTSADEQDLAVGILQSAALSIALQHPDGDARFTIVDLQQPDEADKRQHQDLLFTLRQLGATADAADEADMTSVLENAAEELRIRQNDAGLRTITHYLMILGVDRARGLDGSDAPNGDSGPLTRFRELLRSGPSLGIHLLGWWSNARTFQDHTDFETSDLINGLVVLRCPSDAVTDLLGPSVAGPSHANRVLLRDRSRSTVPEMLVPFASLTRQQLRDLTLQEWDR